MTGLVFGRVGIEVVATSNQRLVAGMMKEMRKLGRMVRRSLTAVSLLLQRGMVVSPMIRGASRS